MWITVKSSNIESLKQGSEEMFVKFKNGSVYAYKKVSTETFNKIVSAESVGKAFDKLIKKAGYDFRKVS